MVNDTKNSTPTLFASVKKALSETQFLPRQYQRLVCYDQSKIQEEQQQRRRTLRADFAKSKSGVAWGPTHSEDSEENDSENPQRQSQTMKEEQQHQQHQDGKKATASRASRSKSGTDTTREETLISILDLDADADPSITITTPQATKTRDSQQYQNPPSSGKQSDMNTPPPRAPDESASGCMGLDKIWQSASEVVSEWIYNDDGQFAPCNQCRQETTTRQSYSKQRPGSPYNSVNHDKHSLAYRSHSSLSFDDNNRRRRGGINNAQSSNNNDTTNVYISRDNKSNNRPVTPSTLKTTTPIQPAQSNKPLTGKNDSSPNQTIVSKRSKPPFDTIDVDLHASENFQRSISELTMQSSYAMATSKLTESRRMAYYAVGKTTDDSSPKTTTRSGRSEAGGNRKCYFSGRLIVSGKPFYAGSVQQGLRTLVVFCQPRALGLPTQEKLQKAGEWQSKGNKTKLSYQESFTSNDAAAPSHGKSSQEEELCAHDQSLTCEQLLRVIPAPDSHVMKLIETRFPEQYATLPKQVRSPDCWRVYIKFCFFSGLPVADGEMYYRVLDNVSQGMNLQAMGTDEIILSHEVMEAVNGEQSAGMLRLPNNKLFQYLKKHYNQQCAKLTGNVFDRRSWEMVLSEV